MNHTEFGEMPRPDRGVRLVDLQREFDATAATLGSLIASLPMLRRSEPSSAASLQVCLGLWIQVPPELLANGQGPDGEQVPAPSINR